MARKNGAQQNGTGRGGRSAGGTAQARRNGRSRGRSRKNEDTSHSALMAALRDEERTRSLFSKVCFMARARYGLRTEDSEDVFHEAVATYLSIHGRYPDGDNHFGLLVGIFHKKVLEHLSSRERQGRVARRYVSRLRCDRPDLARGEDPKGPTVERVIRDEDADLIRAAISALNEPGRDLLLSLAEGRMSRLEMIEEMGINRNTFDTRLRSLRLSLKDTLQRRGVL